MQIAANTGPDNNVISVTCKVNDVGLCKNTQVPTQTTTDHTMKIKTNLSSFIFYSFLWSVTIGRSLTMRKIVKINNVIGVVEEIGEMTFSIRVEDDNYYYLDVIIQAQGDELIAINNGSALASTINNTLGFFLLNIDDSLEGDTRVKLAEKLCSFLHAMI